MVGEMHSIPIDVATNSFGREFRFWGLRRPLFYQGPPTNHNAVLTDVVLTFGVRCPVASSKTALSESRRGRVPVPGLVHQIWLGSKPVPEHFRPWMQGVARFFDGWDYRVWREEDLPGILEHSLVPELIEDTGLNPGLRADVLRYEILRQHGGVYFDCDFEVLRPLAHLIQPGCLHYGDELPGRPANAFLASPAGFEFWGLLLRRIRRGMEKSPGWHDVVRLTGPEAFGAALRDWTGGWTEEGVHLADELNQPYATHYPGNDLVAFWLQTVYPYWYETHTQAEFSRERYPLARAAHHWARTWQQ